MGLQENSNPSSHPRILLVAHCFDANYSMESRLSWVRATKVAEHYDTTIICAEPFADIRTDVDAEIPGLKVVTVAHTEFEKRLINSPLGFYLAYRLWHWRVLQLARKLHRRRPFSLVHQVSYCGYREPGYCWKLGIPFVWGPIGGTQNVPWRFLSQLNPTAAVRECWRNVTNLIQLRFGPHVGNALKAADAVFAANRQVQQSFQRARGIELPCQLETGLHHIERESRPPRSKQRPLRILWAGRLESWKALPLLLKAVAQLPHDLPLELRVLGSGSLEEHWRRQAERLGIAQRIDWIPLPEYGARDEHYAWADVLAFTSLRDTSGTGLLEALAAGVPILGLDHQGARDIMTVDCAVRVPVQTPRQVITDMANGLVQLAEDSQLLQRLSAGAVVRALEFHWDRLSAEMLACYQRILPETGAVSIRQRATEQTPDAEPALAISPRVTT